MSLRIALAQINPTVGDLQGNFDLLDKSITALSPLDPDLIVFPELVVTGYPPEDLLHYRRFLEEAGETVDRLAGRHPRRMVLRRRRRADQHQRRGRLFRADPRPELDAQRLDHRPARTPLGLGSPPWRRLTAPGAPRRPDPAGLRRGRKVLNAPARFRGNTWNRWQERNWVW